MANDELTPPRGFLAILRQLGPGLIVSGSIVGSGELIATPTLGAKVGFSALWLIVVSCLIKVVVQEELGRYTIATGQTPLQALNRIPGPRWRVSWVVWAWVLMFLGVTFQSGGIIGGVGQVFHLLIPQVNVAAWTVLSAVITAMLLIRGRYQFIESSCTVMVVSFTFITVACAALLAWTPYAIQPRDILEGIQFQLPGGGLAVAFAVFGITGVGATELIYYPYWCLEKGYARFAGPQGENADWISRARGWIRVMQIDILLAMAIYTVATVAFYLLGASILNGLGQIPAGYDMVRTLSYIYTGSLGNWSFYLFLVGAFFVLYSTVFASTASNSRVLVDFLQLIGWITVLDEKQRWFWRRSIVLALLALYTFWYLSLGEPVLMVIIGGMAQACMLPIIGFSTIYLRYKCTPRSLSPQFVIDLLLWLCSSMMLAFAVFTVASRLLQ